MAYNILRKLLESLRIRKKSPDRAILFKYGMCETVELQELIKHTKDPAEILAIEHILRIRRLTEEPKVGNDSIFPFPIKIVDADRDKIAQLNRTAEELGNHLGLKMKFVPGGQKSGPKYPLIIANGRGKAWTAENEIQLKACYKKVGLTPPDAWGWEANWRDGIDDSMMPKE